MVRLAQDFSTRCTLVEGQGNFGSVDGDGAAAMRYTEARLSKLSMEMVRDLDKETVDFYPNFDETLMQPAVLPARFPNLLVNGSQGIAVGMATNIPPHNLGEAIDGVVMMIDNPNCTTDDLMTVIKGPDFPTGGVFSAAAASTTPTTRAAAASSCAQRARSRRWAATASASWSRKFPTWSTRPSSLRRSPNWCMKARVDGISDVRDESDREGMRIVIELKRDVNANVVLNYLYKHTQLQGHLWRHHDRVGGRRAAHALFAPDHPPLPRPSARRG